MRIDMTRAEISKSLAKLVKAVPPPASPLHPSGTPDPYAPELPSSYLQLLTTYGSGHFLHDDKHFLEFLNPFAPGYKKSVVGYLDLLRELKTEAEDSNVLPPMPYDVWPEKHGLYPWAFGEGRKHYFWLTKGSPQKWTVVTMYDIEEFTEFDIPAAVFLQRLVCGEIDASFFGFDGPLDPTKVTFCSEPPRLGEWKGYPGRTP